MKMAQNKLIYSYNLILLGTRPLNLRKKVALEKVAKKDTQLVIKKSLDRYCRIKAFSYMG